MGTDMREHWDAFAREDAMFYVASNRENWTREDFLEQGRGQVEEVMSWLDPKAPRERMLEVGCGVGRMIVHFARFYERADGVDVSPEMISQARAIRLPGNVHLDTVSGSDLAQFQDGAFDLVFTFQVLQHIPHEDTIAGYLREMKRVLRPGGRVVAQFDSRGEPLAARAAYALPDVLLPRTRRRYMRCYRRKPTRIAQLCRAAELMLVSERGVGTRYHWVVLSA